MNSDFNKLIDQSARESQDFCLQFFRALDDYRGNLTRFILPNSAIIWNGVPLGGDQAFMAMYDQMPVTKHDVTDYNVHPLPKSNNQQMDFVLDTSGKVKLGDERGTRDVFAFSAVFILIRNPSIAPHPVVKSVTYRLVYKPSDTTITM